MHHFETVSQAVQGLQQRGYAIDFNLQDNCLVCHTDQFGANEFEITECYRFEGDSDPADEAIVYGVEAYNGLKGILVNGYGMYSSSLTSEIAQKLRFHATA
ncbi:hypothetical protein I2I11_12670 [Pontibacter sp. 172403-2]|uniref:hypothetical protein n=1 Tax=Pontibacter rufus TaxID=2791028 RepID=UPI0018B01093|nr:hypothetical protein [Pontibacter sp. 172403-2]MBF9254150.1 hypothetical protein [Pontibacter sp. 172403-2]